jgi:hypothetical protein
MFEIDWQILFSNQLLRYTLDIFCLEVEDHEKPQNRFLSFA